MQPPNGGLAIDSMGHPKAEIPKRAYYIRCQVNLKLEDVADSFPEEGSVRHSSAAAAAFGRVSQTRFPNKDSGSPEEFGELISNNGLWHVQSEGLGPRIYVTEPNGASPDVPVLDWHWCANSRLCLQPYRPGRYWCWFPHVKVPISCGSRKPLRNDKREQKQKGEPLSWGEIFISSRGAKTFTPNRRATATLNSPTLAILNWLARALGAGSAAFWLSHSGPKRYILRRLIRLAVIQRGLACGSSIGSVDLKSDATSIRKWGSGRGSRPTWLFSIEESAGRTWYWWERRMPMDSDVVYIHTSDRHGRISLDIGIEKRQYGNSQLSVSQSAAQTNSRACDKKRVSATSPTLPASVVLYLASTSFPSHLREQKARCLPIGRRLTIQTLRNFLKIPRLQLRIISRQTAEYLQPNFVQYILHVSRAFSCAKFVGRLCLVARPRTLLSSGGSIQPPKKSPQKIPSASGWCTVIDLLQFTPAVDALSQTLTRIRTPLRGASSWNVQSRARVWSLLHRASPFTRTSFGAPTITLSPMRVDALTLRHTSALGARVCAQFGHLRAVSLRLAKACWEFLKRWKGTIYTIGNPAASFPARMHRVKYRDARAAASPRRQWIATHYFGMRYAKTRRRSPSFFCPTTELIHLDADGWKATDPTRWTNRRRRLVVTMARLHRTQRGEVWAAKDPSAWTTNDAGFGARSTSKGN
ncbi:hypothetical protein DFH08DRAFT_804460 [Mycena albidolilacea]|uniref:Uncharacterized protein n=1 Tax=Mycena albidolilacea TaxID=1033008 RepID=A0AAD7EYJ8_9AGAR|nr:hypothetical protein DFH08DRAFT_804460 [Mycena albidolilacea]